MKSITLTARLICLTIFCSWVQLICSSSVYAQLQSGAIGKGIDKATSELQDVGKSVGSLMLPICLIMGVVGGIQCVSKFFNNDPDFKKSIINWGSAIIFAGVVGLVLNAAFGK